MSNTTGITKHGFNSLYRVVKHTVKRYPQIKAKVKDATNTDPWGPSTEDKSILAEACFHSDDREIIMRALFGRMRKSEKLIQVAKALDCLYYIALHGPDEVILDLRNDAELVYNVLRTAPSSESALIRRAEKVRELIQEPAVVVAERERARRLCEKMSTTMFSTVDRGGSSDSYNDTAPNGGTLEGSPSLSVCVGGGLLPSGPSSPNHANSSPKAGNSGTDPVTPKLKKLPSSGNLSLPPSGSLSRNQLPGSSPRGPVNNASAPWAPQPRPADTLDGIFSSSNTLGIFPTGASVSVGAPQAFQPGPPSSASWSTNGVSNPNNGTNVPFQPQEDWFPFGNDSTNAQPAVPETCFMTGGKSSELSWDFTKPQTNTATSQPTPVNSVKSSHHPKDPSAALDELFGVKAPSKDIRSLNELRASPQM